MKKTILLLSAIILFFTGCKKFDDIEASKLEIKNEIIEKGWDYIKISGEYAYPVELEAMILLLSEKEDMSEAKSYECVLEGKTFSVEVTDLKEGVTYFYCYEYDNGYGKEKSEVLRILSVTTNDVTDVTSSSAKCGGKVVIDGNATVVARGVCWSTSQNPTIDDNKTTDGSGIGRFTSNLTNLNYNTTYYVRAYATNEKGTIYGEEKNFKTEGLSNGYDWVDLGLPSGLKWATCNVGANAPEVSGSYFAWGETTAKFAHTEENSLTYGLTISELQSQGYIDVEGNLTSSHDAATVNCGDSWRMPTKTEMQELVNECTWIWTTQKGVNGYEVASKTNGNSIFLPAAGYRNSLSLYSAGELVYYWCSTPCENNIKGAYYLVSYSGYHGVGWGNRYYGRTIRPVSE